MKLSLSYYFVLLVLRFKGVKQIFSKSPLDFHKLRKEDVKSAPITLAKNNNLNEYCVLDSQITVIGTTSISERLLLFFPGGAFVSGPSKHHWDTAQKIHDTTKITVWLCDYPKAPESEISQISDNVDAIYKEALDTYRSDAISLMGDSVGGTLITALIQRIIENKLPKPSQIFLISPVVDSSLSNPEIFEIDRKDPMLSRNGVLSAKKLCSENDDLNDVRLSPINGSFDEFPKTHLYIAEYDITYPDQKKMVQRLKESNIGYVLSIGHKMPHIWPFLPFMKESKKALNEIIKTLAQSQKANILENDKEHKTV